MKLLINYSILLIFIFILKLPGSLSLSSTPSPTVSPFLPPTDSTNISSTPQKSDETLKIPNEYSQKTKTAPQIADSKELKKEEVEIPLKVKTNEELNNSSLRSKETVQGGDSLLIKETEELEKPKAKGKDKDKDKDAKPKPDEDLKLDLKKRLKKYKARIIIGSILCFIALIITLINEFIQLRESRIFEDSLRSCREVSIEEYEKELEGKLVIANGTIFASNKLLDQETGISVEHSLKLSRVVEMNQWKEVSRDGKTAYQQVWSTQLIPSERFQNKNYLNPGKDDWLLENKTFYAENASLGFYKIQAYHIEQIKKQEGVFLPDGCTDSVEGNMRYLLERKGQGQYFVLIKNNFIYIKSNGNKMDSVGDIRIKYQRVASKDYTFVAGQCESTLLPITASGDVIRGVDEQKIKELNQRTTIFWVEEGKRIKQEMFRLRDTRNLKRDWALRVFAICLCFLGIYLILFPFNRNLKELRLISSFGKFAQLFLTFVITSLAALLIIGGFWIFRKPCKGFFMLLAMIPFIVILIVIFKKPGLPSKDKKDKGKKGKKK